MTDRVYTDNDPIVCDWMARLVEAGHLRPGRVECTDVTMVAPAEELHLFAGIGGWPLALQQAGWPGDVPVWTGSCPCQPFSVAGKKKGTKDERHLWPAMRTLIEKHRPRIVLGEQVASPAGRAWLDDVSADLEALGFAVGAADLCAAGVGAPHLRQRLFWVGIANGERRERLGVQLRERRQEQAVPEARGPGATRRSGAIAPGPVGGFWHGAEWVPCADGKSRPIEPGSFPVADGVPGRVGRLRAYGNSIVVPLAAEFVRAVMDELEGA